MEGRSIRKSIIAWLGGVFGALVLAWVLLVLFLDTGTVDDSDLVISPREVDPAQNPYPEIRDLELSEEETAELRRVNAMLLGSAEMDPAFLLELLERHRPLLDRFYRYAAMEEWRQDRPEGSDFPTSYVFHWSALVPLAVVDGTRLAEMSKTTEAVDAHLAILRFGSKLQSSEVGTVEWTIGWRMREQAYRGLLSLLDRKRTGEAELHRLVDAMDDPLVRSQQLDRVVRAEYTFAREALEGVANDPRGSGYRWVPMRAVYKENRTLHGLAENHRRALELSGTTLEETRAHLEGTANPARVSEWIAMLGGNWQGVDLMNSFGSNLWDMVERSFLSRAQHEVFRTRVALELYRLDHEAWPADLGALVPGYLEAVPLDPVEGKPLRYDRKRRVLYSIGDNLLDEKGLAPDKSGSLRSRAEIVIELEPEVLAPWPDFGAAGE